VRDDHSEVATSTDDYLWLKLGLVTFDETEASSRDGVTLTQLQMMLLEDFGVLLYLLSLCSSFRVQMLKSINMLGTVI